MGKAINFEAELYENNKKVITDASVGIVRDGIGADVTIRPVNGNLLFDFTIPRGSQGYVGPIGPTGATGLTGPAGPQGPAGENFKIYSTYGSESEIIDDLDNIPLNAFVLISSSVEDEDNGKLYVKDTETSIKFIVDLSSSVNATSTDVVYGTFTVESTKIKAVCDNYEKAKKNMMFILSADGVQQIEDNSSLYIVDEDYEESVGYIGTLSAREVNNKNYIIIILREENGILVPYYFDDLYIDKNIEKVFQYVSNGKKMVALAITDRGVSTENNATFEEMRDNILKIGRTIVDSYKVSVTSRILEQPKRYVTVLYDYSIGDTESVCVGEKLNPVMRNATVLYNYSIGDTESVCIGEKLNPVMRNATVLYDYSIGDVNTEVKGVII